MRVDERGLRVDAGGERRFLAWAELEAVALETSGGDPTEARLAWLLGAGDGQVVLVPSDARGGQALLERLQELPGFDRRAVLNAALSWRPRTFVCWRAPSWVPPV